MLPTNQVKMPLRKEEEGKRLQNKEGAGQVWEGVLSDYQGCRKIGEEEQRESPCS